MITLPATAGVTTTRLIATAKATGIAAGLLVLATAGAEVLRQAAGEGPGAHKLLLLAVGVTALAAVLAWITAGIRRLITTATTAVLVGQARMSTSVVRIDETQRQLVAELARLRAQLHDRDNAETSAALQRINLRLLNGK